MNVKLTSTNFAAENLIHNGPKFSERRVETENCSTGKLREENTGTTDNLSLCSRNSTSSTSGSEFPQTGAGRGFQKDLIPRHHTSPSEHTAVSREQEDIPRSSSPIKHIETVPDLPFGMNQSTPVPQKCSPISLSLWSPKWDRRSTLADQPEPQQPIMHPSSSPVLGIPTSNISALSLAYSSLMHAQTLNGAVQRATPHVIPPSSISNLRHPSVSSLTPPTSMPMTDYLDNLARTRHQSFGKNNVNPSQSHFNSLLNNLFSGNMESWHQLQRVAQSSHTDPRLLGLYNGSGYPFEIPGTGRRKNATRETTSMLKAWLNEHRKNPYPTKGEKIMLAIVTKMSLTQVSTWFANARRRLKKENKMTWHSRCSSSIQDVDDDSNEDGPIDDDEEDDTLPRKNLPEGHLLERFLDTGDIQRLAASNLESQQQALFNAEFWKLNHQRLDRDQRKRSPSDGSEIHNRKQRKIWSVADLSQEHKPAMDKESLNENPSLNEYRVQPLSSGVELRRAPELPDKLNENYTMIEAQLRSMTSNLPSIRTDLNGLNPSSMISPAALAAFYLYYQQRQRQATQEFSTEELLSNVRSDSLQTLHSATLRESKPEY